MNELADIILNKTKESSELVNNIENSPYLKSYDYSLEAKQALSYLTILKNFYNFVNKDDEIEKRALKTIKLSFVQKYVDDLSSLEETIKNCWEINACEKRVIRRNIFIAGFSSLGLFLNPVFAVPTTVCLCACIYPGYKLWQVTKYKKDFVHRIKKDKEDIEYWDSIKIETLKQVLLDNKTKIRSFLK